MIRLFSDPDLFEEILFEDNDTTLSNIVNHHAQVFLNMNDDALAEEEEKMEYIFRYKMTKGNNGVIPLDYHFDSLDADPSLYAEDPRSMHLRNKSDQDVKQLSEDYGVVILNKKSMNNHGLNFLFDKDLIKEEVLSGASGIGWHDLIPDVLFQSNSLVITDNYLFANESGERGEKNICQLVEKLLPNNLSCDFHLLIIAPEHVNYEKADCTKQCGRIKTFIDNLRKPYNIIFEMAYAETIHNRIAISNYYTIVLEKGFDVFKTVDLKTVHEDSDIQIKGIFTVSDQNQTSGMEQADNRLRRIRKKLINVKEYISNRKEDKNFRIFGDCNKDKSINNRLLNEFDKY